ncbi:MAG: D-sedoheptulose 7-phosphate isomerase [Phycisphaeraceae bacterium]|nr:D-sedoheptulose 7-phosphate isomerase [Phycisphaeraceae bacterium]
MYVLLLRGVRVYAFAMLESLKSAQRTLDEFCTDSQSSARISGLAGLLAACFRAGGKVLICGNGGSLADAVHFAEELTGRFRDDRPALPAIAIAEPGHITCTANDYGFERIFSRAVEALGREGDVLIALSTSGNSANIVLAVEAARSRKMATVALLGRGGGRLKGVCDHEIIAPGLTADRIQEIHMLVLHILVELVEVELGYARK